MGIGQSKGRKTGGKEPKGRERGAPDRPDREAVKADKAALLARMKAAQEKTKG